MSIDTAVILCGGRGSRFIESVRGELRAFDRRIQFPHLGPHQSSLSHDVIQDLEHTPKCLLPLRGEPLIAHKMRQLKEAGVTRCVIRGERNAAAILSCIRTHHLDQEFDITVLGTSLFNTGDLAGVARAAKKCGSPEHLIVTAGDCLTTTSYQDLISSHLSGNHYLTISTTDRRDKEVFVQDSVVSAQFIKNPLAHSSRTQRHFPACSPFVAAIQYAWHEHTVNNLHREVHYININKLSDFERLLALQDTLLPSALHPRPSLTGHEKEQEVRIHHRPIQP